MDQYDVYRLKRGDIVVILQHDALRAFDTRVVAPILPRSRSKLSTSLNPVLRHAGRDWVLATHLLNVVRKSALSECLGEIRDQDYTIKRAVDQLFFGI